MNRPDCVISGLLAISLAAAAGAATPQFVNPTPAARTSSSTPSPIISIEVIDPSDGIDSGTLGLVVLGADVTADTSITPIPDGFRLTYTPASAFSMGLRVGVEVSAEDVLGEASSYGWQFYVDSEYAVGTIVVSLDHNQSTAQQVYDGYGLAMRLAGQGYRVDWIVDQAKAYGGIDLTATVDDAPIAATPGSDGVVASVSYAAAPFLISDPDPSTSDNEAWNEIALLIATFGYAPNFDEVRAPVQVPREDLMYVTYRARVAAGDNLAKTELDLAQYPYDDVESPGMTAEPATIAGGGLFRRASDPLCGRIRKYDLFILGHYEWDAPGVDELAAISELDEFIAKSGMGIFECSSATIENEAHWVTLPPDPIVEGVQVGDFYQPDPTRIGHPFLQTMGQIPIQGGGFAIWDSDLNQLAPNLQYILVDEDPSNDDIGYVFGSVGSGKAYYMGGHRRTELADRRLVLNALAYNVIYPKYERRFDPELVVAQIDNPVRVDIVAKGGSESLNNVLEDRLDAFTTFVPGTVVLDVPGSSYTWDLATKTLTFDLGDLNPIDFAGGVVGSYQTIVHPASEGFLKILDHTTTYSDLWGADYRLDSTGCSAVRAGPHLELEKSADRADVVATVTTRVQLRLVVRNNHQGNPLHDVQVTDMLPAGVTFVGNIQTSLGTADWNVTTPSTLTWDVGILVPGAEAVLTFDVDVAPGVPGVFNVNDGADATATDRFGLPMTASSGGVDVMAHDPADPVIDFSLTPGSAPASTDTSFEFCATNAGAQQTFNQNGDSIELTIPEQFGSPTNVTVPDLGWTWFWDATDRVLTFRHPGADIDWLPDMSFCFQFDLLTPDWPIEYEFEAEASVDGGGATFNETLPVDVLRDDVFDALSDESGSAEPCATITYAHQITNLGNGHDVYHISPSSSEGLTVTIYMDLDFDGVVGPSDLLLVDNDGDGAVDTNGVAPGDTATILVVIELADSAVDYVDVTTLTLISDADPNQMSTLLDTTSVPALVLDVTPDAPEICEGESITLDATPGLASYDWSTGDLTPSTTVSPTVSTTYDVIGRNPYGCEVTSSELVTVHTNPTPSIGGNTGPFCGCTFVNLDCGPFATCEWSTGDVGGSIVVEICATTNVSVTVTDSNGCQATADVTITIDNTSGTNADAGPEWTVFCDDTTVPLGAAPEAGATYSWDPPTGLDDPTSASPNATAAVTTDYTVTKTAASGCISVDITTVIVDSSRSPLLLGNVLREVKVNGFADIQHSWTDLPSGTDYDVGWSDTKDQTLVNMAGSAVAGPELLVEVGAVNDANLVKFYQVSGTDCTPISGGSTP